MKRFLLLLVISLFFLLPACDKGFEELNRDPFSPTQTDIGPLFNTVLDLTRLGWDEQFYIHNETLYGITQLAALTDASFQNIAIGTEDIWKNYYKTLAHIRSIENRLEALEVEAEALNNVQAMLKIITAYRTFRITDLFGDMPFFDAGKGFESLEFARPKFDSQEEIYKFLLEELKWAEEHINTIPNPMTESGTAYISFGGFDNLFFGDMLHWRKFANSLRLRHALRMVEKDPNYAHPILAKIIEEGLPVIEEGEEVWMQPENQNWLNKSLNWSFREHGEHGNLRMGTNIWSLFSETDSGDGSGIYDPRAYIFFEANNANEWVAHPQIASDDTPPIGGTPYQQQRDANYTLKGTSNIYSSFNYYLIRDERHVPQLILTAAEVHFIKAEAHLRGLGIAQNSSQADAAYTLGVVASIKMWQNIVSSTAIWENKQPTLSSGQIFSVVNHPNISIFTSENKLELIYQQRWIDSFRQPWEAYSLMRRTRMTPHEGDLAEHFRFAYPPSESADNPENWAAQLARMGEDSEKVKVWWNEE